MRRQSILIIILFLSASFAPIVQSILVDSPPALDDSLGEVAIYKISPPLQPEDMLGSIEIVGGLPNQYHYVIVPEGSINRLSQRGYEIELLEDETASLSPSFADEYHTLNELMDFLNTTSLNYPEITKLTSIGTSIEGRDIMCMEISDNPGVDEDEPGVLFMGLHHAREWPTLEICMYLIDLLTTSYGTDNEITDLIEHRRIWIIPCVNPDGYYYCHDLGADWRKNRHYLEEFNTYGIDLNRNYGGTNNGNPLGMWGSKGMSHYPYDEIYCGAFPFSEPETQAIRDFFLSHDICTSISWHTFSELVLWPWGYSLDEKTPDDEYLSQVGFQIASRITRQNGVGTYVPSQSAGLYPTTGDTTDWIYGYSNYVLGKPHFPFTIEACSTFHPSPTVLPQVCKENADGALYLLSEAEQIDALKPRVVPPRITNVTSNNDQSVHIEWEVMNPASDPESFEIRQLSSLSIDVDNTEEMDRYWDYDGFFPTTRHVYSCNTSYFPFPTSNRISWMTSKYPIPIKRGMNLSFYTYYEIEKNQDMGIVEISTDGRSYQVLDTFTGFSEDWQKKEYPLVEYIGKSIFIRFRFVTDASSLEEGFFIDDIYPVASYESITTIKNTFSTSTDLSTLADTFTFYQVRGYNQAYGWGDWSMLYPFNETFFLGHPPEPAVIQGPSEIIKGEVQTYTIHSYDRDDDPIYYYIKWGDCSYDGWLGPYLSNETVEVSHTWQETGDYTIEVQVKDASGLLSQWNTLDVSLSKQQGFISILLDLLNFWRQWFHQMFPLIV